MHAAPSQSGYLPLFMGRVGRAVASYILYANYAALFLVCSIA